MKAKLYDSQILAVLSPADAFLIRALVSKVGTHGGDSLTTKSAMSIYDQLGDLNIPTLNLLPPTAVAAMNMAAGQVSSNEFAQHVANWIGDNL